MPHKPLDLIVAYDKNNGIGKNGTIPWRLPEDLKRFAQITTTTMDPNKQNAVIMGRKTWDSIPAKFRPLPNRFNIVLTLSNVEFPGALTVHSFHSALGAVNYDPKIERGFIIGGAEVYKRALEYVDGVYVTALAHDAECDVHFPVLGNEFILNAREEPRHYNGIDFKYLYYERVKQKTLTTPV